MAWPQYLFNIFKSESDFMDDRRTAVIVVAAGRGERAKRPGESGKGPKQYRAIGASSVLAETVCRFDAHPLIDDIVVVIHADDRALYDKALSSVESRKLRAPVTGGATRQDSVFAGLKALRPFPSGKVLVHDGVRPFVSDATIDRVIGALDRHPAILPALPVVDTIKYVETLDGTGARIVRETVDRSRLWSAQTPQGFHFAPLCAAHEKAAGQAFTDDCAVMEADGHKVHVVEGNAENFKITTADDIDEAARRMEKTRMMETRVGNGFDVHAFEDGNAVILGGISIPHTKKLKGHSDADVALHTLTDAIYGALADGDIGSHFPPSDPQWKGASSDRFLIHACERVKARGGRILHLDLTLMCEAPKIGPHREAMRAEIARICALPLSRVAVKATTTERLGFTGREEGIAAMATATIQVPFEE